MCNPMNLHKGRLTGGLINDMPSVMKLEQPKRCTTQHKQEVEEPKQPPSAYNLFFQVERHRILNGTDQDGIPVTIGYVRSIREQEKEAPPKRVHRKTHGKIGFQELTRKIAARWKKIDAESRKVYDHHARLAKEEYVKKREEWKASVGEEEAKRCRKNKKQRSSKKEKSSEESHVAEHVASHLSDEDLRDRIRSAVSDATMAGSKMETLERLLRYTTAEIAKLQDAGPQIDDSYVVPPSPLKTGMPNFLDMNNDPLIVFSDNIQSDASFKDFDQPMEDPLSFDMRNEASVAELFLDISEECSGPQGNLEDFKQSSIFQDASRSGYDLTEPSDFDMLFSSC